MSGWIYIITNKSMPGIVKVGYTERDPEDRARELTNEGKTGVPWEYVVEYALQIHNPYQLERRVHDALEQVRENREWFRCSIGHAKKAIQKEATFQERDRGQTVTRKYLPSMQVQKPHSSPQSYKRPAPHKPFPLGKGEADKVPVHTLLEALQEAKPQDSDRSLPVHPHNPPPPSSFIRDAIRVLGIGWVIIMAVLGVLVMWLGFLSLLD